MLGPLLLSALRVARAVGRVRCLFHAPPLPLWAPRVARAGWGGSQLLVKILVAARQLLMAPTVASRPSLAPRRRRPRCCFIISSLRLVIPGAAAAQLLVLATAYFALTLPALCPLALWPVQRPALRSRRLLPRVPPLPATRGRLPFALSPMAIWLFGPLLLLAL